MTSTEHQPGQRLSVLRSIALESGVVHVIRVRLDDAPVAALQAVVTDEERGRAARFVHDRDRLRHTVGRGTLRLALASLVNTDPRRIRLRSTDLGKPFLDTGTASGSAPCFSISHSGNEVLVAIAPTGRIGVDVEEVRTLKDLLSLARTSFTYAELQQVAALPDDARARAFFRIWTRKEAMLKALGCGLSGLDGIAVSGDAMEGNALLRMDNPPELEKWTVQSLAVHPDVESALAWDQPLLAVRHVRV